MSFLIKIAVFAALVFLISLTLVDKRSEQTDEPITQTQAPIGCDVGACVRNHCRRTPVVIPNGRW